MNRKQRAVPCGRSGPAAGVVLASGSRGLPLAARVREGVRAGEFRVAFQPAVHVRTGQVSCIECLLRWQHPAYGMLLPGAFLQAFEQDAHAAGEAGYFVLQSACEQIRALQRDGRRVPRIAVNILPSQLLDDALHDRLYEITARHDIDPALFELELVETEDAARLLVQRRFTHALSRLGVRFALDDFGTGYSSLAALASVHVGKLKLARELLRDVPASDRSCRVVAALLRLAVELGMEVTVEGVEVDAQWRWLSQFADVQVQGYYVARPKQTLAQAVAVVVG